LYTIQNVAFIIAANLTYIASVLAILATGPLMSCFAAKAFLGESVPRHTWIAAVVCAACVLVLFSDAFVERPNASGTDAGTSAPTTRDHLVGNLVALVVPAALALYWTACKSADASADMIPALALSGLGGGALAIAVVFASVPSDRDPSESPESPFMPNPPDADGGVALAALLTQTVSVALAFALLTIGAKQVPSAEVSLIMLIELALGPALVWAAVGEVPTWRVWLGSAGVLVTMAVESAVGVADERRKASVSSPASETGGDAAA
jgi:drug/metabolite transporter (DMT)-like permease